MLTSESILVLNGNLIPAGATCLWTSNFLSISVITSSRPMNFESLSNGTVKKIVRDEDVRSDKLGDTRTGMGMKTGK